MWRKLWIWVRFRFNRRDISRELDDELRFHLEMQIEENGRHGLSARDARRAALLQFGGVEQVRLDCRDAWAILDRFRLDLTHALRSMRARPGATAATVGVLILGISLTTVIFAVADPFLLRPLPYSKPDRLVVIEPRIRLDRFGQRFDAPSLDEWQARTDLFESVGAFGGQEQTRVRAPNGAVIIKTRQVSEDFFDTLGVRVSFTLPWRSPGTGAEGQLALWEGPRAQSLGEPAGIVGRSFGTQDGGSLRVAALLPPGFLFPYPRAESRPDALSPARFGPIITHPSSGRTDYLTIIARLRPGVTIEAVQSALSPQSPDSPYTVGVQPIANYMRGNLRPLALGALAAGLLVSLVCAANVANLLIARGAYRTREFATREALGASRMDLLRLILVELSAVTSLAIVASLVVARLLLAVMTQVIPSDYVALGQPTVTLRIAAFACLLGAGIVLAGIVPAWAVWRTTFSTRIHLSLASETRKLKWLRFAMAASQSATAMVLLVGGALLVRSYINLWVQDTGFSGNVGIVSVSYPARETPQQLVEEIRATVAQLVHIPGITIAGATSSPFLDKSGMAGGVRTTRIAGRVVPLWADEVTPGFFEAVGAQCRAGRMLGPGDRGWNAVMVNESFARWLLPNAGVESAVGKVGTLPDGTMMEIVGVVQDIFNLSLDRKPSPKMYMPVARPRFVMVQYVVRLRNRSTPFEASARKAIAGLNVDAVVIEAGFLDDRVAGTVNARSFATLILSLFTVAGLGITASGLFGIVAFVVARRTREIAIRKAVGAQARHILWVVIREAVTAATLGSAGGLLVGRWLSTLLKSQLYGITPGDAGSLAVAGCVMILIVAIAAWIPARRAAQLSTTEALRIE